MLRDYQQDAVYELRLSILRSESAVYVLPTGGGKTVVAAEISRLASDKGSRTLFLVHRRELVKQAINTLEEACPGMSIGVEAAGWPSMPWAPLQVGMVQSIARRSYNVKPALVIIDEAHHARAKIWEKVLATWPDAKRIGLTATPERLDGKGLGQHFAEMVLGPTIVELVDAGHLAPIRTLVLPSRFRRSEMRKNRSGELRRDDVEGQMTDAVVASGVDAYLRYAKGKKAIFFGIHTDHSRRVCTKLREHGVRAEHVDGKDGASRRDRIMNELRTGGLDVVGNCDLISEGFDAPSCEVVMMGAPTMSVTRYLQQAGRAMRPGQGKTALILDLAGNSHELGLPDEVREWSLEDGEVRDEQKKKMPPRVCLRCKTAFRGRRCPYCAYEEPLAQVAEVETELEEAKARAPKKGKRRSEVWRDLAIAKKSRNPQRSLELIAERRGYNPRWVGHILRAWGME